MTHIPIKSSNIATISYEEDGKILHVRFKNSDTDYEYLEVPERIVRGLIAAESQGRYFGTHVVGQFTTRKRRPNAENR